MSEVVGIILAGGLSRRMGGGDKGLLFLGGRPLLARVAERVGLQVGTLLLNANGEAARFAPLGLPVLPDDLPDRPGPLAGLLAGLDWTARNRPEAGWVATFPADAPFLPGDLVARLKEAAEREGVPAACAASGGRLHAVCGLWRPALAERLRAALGGGLRRVGQWAAEAGAARVDYPVTPHDPFFNINTAEDLSAAEDYLSAR